MGEGLQRARAAARATQRRNRYGITVQFPAGYDQVPELAGTTQSMWYPTAEAADLAASGFKMRGCTIVPDVARRADP